MEIEVDILDSEQVLQEAESLVESTTNETALDAYFSILGNCPNIEQKQQIKLAAEYHAEVQQCQQVMNKIPGKVGFLLQVLTEIGNGERLENFVVSDKAVRKQEFFEGLQKLAALKNPDLAHWHIRPTLMLNWSRRLIENYHNLPQRPWIYKITRTNKQAADDLALWVKAACKLEDIALLAINQLAFYINELKLHAAKAESIFSNLIEANLKLVVAMAKRYQHRGLDLDDLIQEGNLGLMKGIERYQAAKGFNVSTYVVWWIRQSIAKALMTQGYIIRYPPSVHELLRKVNRLTEDARKAGQPAPTVHQMAKQLGTSPVNIDAALSMFQIVSLNQTTGNGDETLENVIPGEDGITFREGEELREAIETLLKNLNPNEQRALKLRFGIPNGIVSAINEIGAELRITRDRVRQMEAKAFAKLRKSHRVQTQKAKYC
jgi:RNA polymerase nonessential primary-like sigma factor